MMLKDALKGELWIWAYQKKDHMLTYKILKLAEFPQKLGMAPWKAFEEKFKAWRW
jgi:hypothetical protein